MADQRGNPRGQHPDDLGERPADQVGGVGGGPVPFKHGHHEAGGLRGAERERRQPHAPADLVTAVRAADGLDRQPRLAQDRDVPPRGALGDAEPLAEPLRGDARGVLYRFQGK
jgi:hypothetical protein